LDYRSLKGHCKEIAIQMANAGAKLILTARSVEKLESLIVSLEIIAK